MLPAAEYALTDCIGSAGSETQPLMGHRLATAATFIRLLLNDILTLFPSAVLHSAISNVSQKKPRLPAKQ